MESFTKEIIEKAEKIKLLLTDCDGVLTDGGVYYSEKGEELKRFSMRDGMGVARLKKLVDVETGVITGERSEIVQKRVRKLGITEYYPGSKDKYHTFKTIIRKKKLSAFEVAYIGDDSNDLELMKYVGLSACPSDAMPVIIENADLKLNNKGGHEAFREFAEIIIFSKTNSL